MGAQARSAKNTYLKCGIKATFTLTCMSQPLVTVESWQDRGQILMLQLLSCITAVQLSLYFSSFQTVQIYIDLLRVFFKHVKYVYMLSKASSTVFCTASNEQLRLMSPALAFWQVWNLQKLHD